MRSFLCFVSVLFLVTALSAAPVNISVSNGNFEVNHPAAGVEAYTIDNWSLTCPGYTCGVQNPTGTGWYTLPLPVAEGTTVAYSNGGSLAQVLTSTFAANTTYSLSVDIGERLDYQHSQGYTVSLYAGSTLLQTLTSATNPAAGGGFSTVNLVYNYSAANAANVGQALKIVLSAPGPQTAFDNVVLTADAGAVPEPTTYGLIAFGLLAIPAARRYLKRH